MAQGEKIYSGAGSSSFSFLKIGVGARAAGMGDAYTAIANDATACYWNPAGLVRIRGAALTFMHNEYFQDVRNDYCAFVYGIGKSAVGIGMSGLYLGGIEWRDKATKDPIGLFRAYDFALDLSLAYRLGKKMAVGISYQQFY